MTYKEARRAVVDAFEKDYLRRLMFEVNDVISQAAKRSGLSPRHVRSLLVKHGMYRDVVRARIAKLQDLEETYEGSDA